MAGTLIKVEVESLLERSGWLVISIYFRLIVCLCVCLPTRGLQLIAFVKNLSGYICGTKVFLIQIIPSYLYNIYLPIIVLGSPRIVW